MNLFDIKDRKAIVTGATRGLGYGMAEGLMEAGAEVVIVGTTDKVNKLAEDFCNKGYKCHGVVCDLSNRADLNEKFIEMINLLGGHLDIFINGAGVQRRHFCEDFPMDDWDDVIEVNLTAAFELAQLSGRQFIKQKSKGKIILVASMLTFFGGYTVPAYAASKGGIAQLTKALSNEWMSKGINVNAIAPGYMDTDMNSALMNDNKRNDEILSRIPARDGELLMT